MIVSAQNHFFVLNNLSMEFNLTLSISVTQWHNIGDWAPRILLWFSSWFIEAIESGKSYLAL